VSTADQNPQLQLDALSAADCLKTYTDTATGTKAGRPQWNACLCRSPSRRQVDSVSATASQMWVHARCQPQFGGNPFQQSGQGGPFVLLEDPA